MKICVIGHEGFIGSEVFRYLTQAINCDWIYGVELAERPLDWYDCIVNCAGCSRKSLANSGTDAGLLCERAVLDTIRAVDADAIVHISSIDAEVYPQTAYGKLKRYVEEEVHRLRDWKSWHILRPTMVVGPGLRKNVVRDLLDGKQIMACPDSFFNIVSTQCVCRAIDDAIHHHIPSGTHRVAASAGIRADDLEKLLGATLNHLLSFQFENYDVRPGPVGATWPPLASAEYVSDFVTRALPGGIRP